jgi:hypothetical protein
MGKQQSKAVEQTGTVVNNVELNDIHQAEVVNSDLILLMYVLAIIQILSFIAKVYKMWKKHLKGKYLKRSQSQNQI